MGPGPGLNHHTGLQADIEIELFDENLDHSNRIPLDYVIFQAAGQERLLRPFFRLHDLTHSDIPHRDPAAKIPGRMKTPRKGAIAFSHNLDP